MSSSEWIKRLMSLVVRIYYVRCKFIFIQWYFQQISVLIQWY